MKNLLKELLYLIPDSFLSDSEKSLDRTAFEKFLDEQKTPSYSKQCSCGAKHTSNPKHHLSYCDIKE